MVRSNFRKKLELRYETSLVGASGEFNSRADIDIMFNRLVIEGESGSGKTTLLKVIAGACSVSSGFLRLDGTVFFDTQRRIYLPVHRREIGFVFQYPLLFPHLNIQQNITYSKKIKNKENIDKMISLLEINHILTRLPGKLSRGEQQRVALARTLLSEPKLLLLDEPLTGIDLKRKEKILDYLVHLNEEKKVPLIYVTHSHFEKDRLRGQSIRLENGKIIQ